MLDRRVGLLALSGAVVAAGVWCCVVFLVSDGDEERAAIATGSASASQAPAASVEAVSPAVAVATRELETAYGAPIETGPGEQVGAIDRDLSLHGRVVDVRRKPIAGATVQVFKPAAREFSILDLEYNRRLDFETERRTDVEGRFAFRLERGRPVDLKVTAAGLAARWVTDRYAGELVEVVLDRGCTLSGRITRAVDGRPVDGVRVRVFRLGGPSSIAFHGVTNAAGEYRLEGLPADQMELELLPRREMSPPWFDLKFAADGTLVKDVVLEPGVAVRGRVTDAVSGAPIESAEIGEGWTFRRSVRTDAAGIFELPGFGCAGVKDVHVRAEGYGQQLRQSFAPAVEGAIAADFALQPARRASGRVLDPSGAPRAGVYVAAVASDSTGDGQLTDWPSTRSGADGRFELRTLNPKLCHVLFVREPGFATVLYDFPDSEASEPTLELGDVLLKPAATLLGRVVDERGEGVPDVRVSLQGFNADRGKWIERAVGAKHSAGLLSHYVESRRGRTDDLGRFSFADLPAGSFRLKTRVSGRPESEDVAIEITEGETRSGVEVILPAGAAIAGRVVDDRGEGIVGAWVRVAGAAAGFRDVSVLTKESGRFEVRGLPFGLYLVQANCWVDDASDARARFLPAERKDVEAGVEDLRLEMATGAPTRGELLDTDGAAVAQATLVAKTSHDERRWFATTDRDGKFSLLLPKDAVVEIAVASERNGALRSEAEVLVSDVAAGSRDLVLRFPPSDPGAK